MTQEKQNSLRILQSKPAKKTLGKASIFLFGLILGLLCSAIFFWTFFNPNTITNANNENERIVETNTIHEPEKIAPVAVDTTHEHHTDVDDNNTYKQHLNDKDLKRLFQHNAKTEQVQALEKNPFDQIGGQATTEKPVMTTTPKSPIPLLAKPKPPTPVKPENSTKKTVTKPEVEASVKKPEEVKEVPVEPVKISITSRDIESNP